MKERIDFMTLIQNKGIYHLMKWCWLLAICALMINNIPAQINTKNMKNIASTTNPLICDPNDGICAIPEHPSEKGVQTKEFNKPIKVIYFTDPICSSCWGIEPQLRKLKLEYGHALDIEYRMGGLLPDWSYNSGGISKPSDVSHHWDEVSTYYDMPIDGDVWLEDPLDSSYPPSIAFKAAQLQDQDKALLFLRELRELVFLKKKNIAKWDIIREAAITAGLNPDQLKLDYDGKAKILFEEDLKTAREFGVRGFPAMYFINSSGQKEMVYGSKPYANYEEAIHKLNAAIKKSSYEKEAASLFIKYHTLTAKEFSELSGIKRSECEQVLDEMVKKEQLLKLNTKNGALWILKQKS